MTEPAAHSTSDDADTVIDIIPETAGWTYCGLRVLALAPSQPRRLVTGTSEMFVLPLAGALELEVVAVDGTRTRLSLQGRSSVFTRVTDFAYVGRDSTVELRSMLGAEVALPAARCTQVLPPRYGAADEVPVEVRGAGRATRQVTNFGTPDGWPYAERLIACELITPDGNWSSYPPHKHDRTEPSTVVNEEIYYFRIAGRDAITPSGEGFGYHHTYTGPEHDDAGLRHRSEVEQVRDHDTVLIPHGYHGPSIAAPGYPMYYLNVMAGPGPRSMAFCDDPAHSWIRGVWADQPTDPRCPVTSATGRRDGLRMPRRSSDD